MISPVTLAEILQATDRLQREGDSFVREVVLGEGAAKVVATVVDLLRARVPRCGEALRFLTFHREVPELGEATEASEDLARELEAMARGPNVRERGTAIWALREIMVRERDAILERTARALHAENEIISLSSVLTAMELLEVIDQLVESDDWLLRWSLLPWTNLAVDSPIADDIRRRLAFDEHPLVSAEAHQHLMMLDEFRAAHASTQGFAFAVLSNHGPASSFLGMASDFVEQWPPEKTTYDLEELREFALRSTIGG